MSNRCIDVNTIDRAFLEKRLYEDKTVSFGTQIQGLRL